VIKIEYNGVIITEKEVEEDLLERYNKGIVYKIMERQSK
jgi:hypothetical protein